MDKECCYFCDNTDLVFTHEHYVFCKECMALYTVHIVQKSKCRHVKDGVPTVYHPPAYKNLRKKAQIWKAAEGLAPENYCSVCGAGCIADGW